MRKRIVSMFLVTIMAVSSFGTTVSASAMQGGVGEETDIIEENEEINVEVATVGDAKMGDASSEDDVIDLGYGNKWNKTTKTIEVVDDSFVCPETLKEQVEYVVVWSEQIREGAFEKCTNLYGVRLANCVNTIGNCAFKDCTSLIWLASSSANVVFDGDDVFMGDEGVVITGYENSPAEKYAKDHGNEFESFGKCYLVTYDLGDKIIKRYEIEGEKYSEWEPEWLENHIFTGWYTEKEAGELVTDSICTNEITLYAHWAEKIIPLDRQDGSSDNDRYVELYAKKDAENRIKLYYGKLPQIVRYKYKLEGWYTEPEGGTLVTENSEYDGSKTLYAHWRLDGKIVKIPLIDGDTEIGFAPVYISGSNTTGYFEEFPEIKKDGYCFQGWSSSRDNIYSVYKKGYLCPWNLKKLYAIWTFDISTWDKDSVGYLFKDENGNYIKNTWIKDNLYRYYFDSTGHMAIGWKKIDNKWYYFEENGQMKTGWLQDGDNRYYLDFDGSMLTDKWVEGKYYVKANGVMACDEWVDDGKYYVNPQGVLSSKTNTIYLDGASWDEVGYRLHVDSKNFVCPEDIKSKVRYITIEDSISEIADYAFENCTELIRVESASRLYTIKKVGKNSFKGCAKLRSFGALSLGDDIQIMDGAFSGCKNLEYIAINNPNATIEGKGVFAGAEQVVIGGYAGSYAENYATENNLKFNSLGECYPVTYEMGNQTILKYVVEGSKYLTNNPLRVGFVFKGWYSSETGGELLDNNAVCDGATTVFARWEGSEEGWKHNSKGYWYENEDGSFLKSTWKKIINTWYYFDVEGYMVTGWKKINNQWYYFDQSGAMQTGWHQTGNKWYYLKSNGAMATNQWIDGTYYVKEDGVMATNQWIDDKYYVDYSGKFRDKIRLGINCIWDGESQYISLGRGCDSFVCPEEYRDKVEAVLVDMELNEFADGAFEGCTSLREVSAGLGNGNVTKIGKNAFKGCTNLSKFNAQSSTDSVLIMDGAFGGCENLKDFSELSAYTVLEGDSIFEDANMIKLYGYENSPAQKYAEEHSIPFSVRGECYTVTYNFGDEIQIKYIAKGDSYVSKAPTKKGYMIEGWYTEKEGGERVDERLCCYEEKTLYARLLEGQWKKDNIGYWYQLDNGSYVKNDWSVISGKRYYFDRNGYMVTGWCKIDGKWYYFGTSGAMKIGWIEENGERYYLKSDGTMACNEVIENLYYVKSDGTLAKNEWIENRYYAKSDGKFARNEWVDGKYLNADGELVEGADRYSMIRIKLNGGTCDQDCATTYVGDDGKHYYGDLPVPTKEGYLFGGWDIIKYYDAEETVGREMGFALNGVECEDPTYVLVARWVEEDIFEWDEESKTLTVSGPNWCCPVVYRDRVENVILVKRLSAMDITSVIPSGFEGCPELREVSIAKDNSPYVDLVGSRAFASCPKLERVNFSRGVLEYSEDTFEGDPNVTIIGYSFPEGRNHDYKMGADVYSEMYNIPFESLGNIVVVQGSFGLTGDPAVFVEGEEVGQLPEYSVDARGNIYGGWAFDPYGVEMITPTTVVTPDKTVYCLWYSERHEIEFDTNGSDEILDNKIITKYEYTGEFGATKDEDFVYGELPKLERSGYTFEGWYTAAQGGSLVKESTVFDGHTKLYAHWTEGEWEHNDKGYWFEKEDGSYAQNVWMKIQGKWYYFDKSGYMATGWRKIDNVWYYLTPDGYMATEWQKVGNKWYYFGTNGAMKSNWQKIGNKWYYFEDGALVFGWHEISGKWYYFEKSGEMAASKWINDTYYVKANGVMATNEWIGKYYVDANGKYVKGKTK